MTTRIGKIARLPKSIREQLNLRLENGERGPTILKWLNELPEVQKLLTEQFAGKPIRPQNLSQWRNGGYLDWSRHQILREQTRWTTEQSNDLNSDTDAATISIAENVAFIMSAELAIHVQALGAIKNPKQRFRQFCRLSRELSRMRRDDQRACRTILRREQWTSTRPLIEPDPEPETQTIVAPSEPEVVALPETPESQLNPRPPTLDPSPHPETLAQPEPIAPPELSEPSLVTPPPTLAPSESPEPLSTLNHQLSTLPPIPPNPTESAWKKQLLPVRGRRFVCVEG